jgi:uncharacterized protein (DUF697 family)
MSATEHAEVVTSGEVKCESKLCAANALTKKYTYWAMGAGAVPVPVLDLAAILAVQTKLLCEMSELYGVKFMEHKAQNIIGVLIAGVGGGRVIAPVVASFVKLIPIVGHFSANIALAASAGGATYALGKVFIQHYESGGTLLDFDPEKTKAYFAEHLKEGQKLAADAKAAV